jgi:hypothetical protein
MAMATARPNPTRFHPLVVEDEAGEDHHHHRSRGEDHPRGGADAVDHRTSGVAGALVLLAYPAEQEHRVVGGEPEQDGEEHHWRERLHRTRLCTEQVRGPPAPLEDGHHRSVGRTDREQVHDHGGQRDEQ